MTREDECNALVDISRIYDGNLKTYNLDPPPEIIREFLRGHRSLKTRQAVLFAALTAVKTAERLKRKREAGKPKPYMTVVNAIAVTPRVPKKFLRPR